MHKSKPKDGNAGKPWLAAILSAVILLLLVACGGNKPPTSEMGRVSGTVVANTTGSSVSDAAASRAALSISVDGQSAKDKVTASAGDWSTHDSNLNFVPGEIVVRFAEGGVRASALQMLEVSGQTLRLQRSLAAAEMRLYVAPGLDSAATLATAQALNDRSDVLFAHPNYIYHPTQVPNDPFYDEQWHFDAIDMEGAWQRSTGSSAVVVAVLDSGIIYTHPDFDPNRVLGGYDFIKDPLSANDDDGRDDDPFDTVTTGSGYHGTHVAGTIGAATDNGQGVAGVDWNAKILPIRVLGADGGTFVDIADALIWAAGGVITGVPHNQNPADVINLSLGGEQECLTSWQSVIDEVHALSPSTVIVAAAGNANINASGFVPANCHGLITVGATDINGERASYSNFGPAIDVMAPGGDGSDFVMSLGYDDYVGMQGTSMATPHVSGIVALMKAYAADAADVDTNRALQALIYSATPLSDADCDNLGAPGRTLSTWDCGFGLINAAIALDQIDSGVPPAPSGVLSFDPVILDLGDTNSTVNFSMMNVSGASIVWEMVPEIIQDPGNPAPVFWDDFDPHSDSLGDGSSQVFNLMLDRSQLTAAGLYRIWIGFEVDGVVHRYQIRFVNRNGSAQGPTGPMLVAAYQQDEFGALFPTGSQTSHGVITNFSFDVEAGPTIIGAWSDENEDGEINNGDFVGFLDAFVNVSAGSQVSGLTVVIDPFFGSPTELLDERYRLLQSTQEQ